MNLMGAGGNIIATFRGTGDSESWYLYNKDIRESTSSIIGADGEAAATYEYDDFGNTAVTGGADFDNEICYTGQIYDRSSGLYYYNARYYDPENGRFIMQDTYRGENTEPDTLHLYAYCANNPINYVDPSGHKRYKKIFGISYGKKGTQSYTHFEAEITLNIKNKKGSKKKGIYNPKATPKITTSWWITTTGLIKDYKKTSKDHEKYVARFSWGYSNAFNNITRPGLHGYYVLDITIKADRKYEAFRATIPKGSYPIKWGNQKRYKNIYGNKTYMSGTLK